MVLRVRVKVKSSAECLSDRIAIGVLTCAFPASLVDDVLARTGRVPSTAAICKARSRLGVEPVKELLTTVCRPVAAPDTRGAL